MEYHFIFLVGSMEGIPDGGNGGFRNTPACVSSDYKVFCDPVVCVFGYH